MRKGIGWAELATGIVALALIITLFSWIPGFQEKGTGEAQVQSCALSVREAATIRAAGTPLTKINCPRKYRQFTDESQAEINAAIAKDIMDAIYILGEGYYDWTQTTIWSNTGVCMILYTYSFDESYVKDYDPYSLGKYLKTRRPRNTGKTYMEYFQEIEQRKTDVREKLRVLIAEKDKKIYIDPKQDYVLFFGRTTQNFVQKYLFMIGPGANQPLSAVLLLPSRGAEMCEQVMN